MFAEVVVDVLFFDALALKEEMKALYKVATSVPKMANMLEGGGKMPILAPSELEDTEYNVVAYPLSLMGVSICAMEDALVAIKRLTYYCFMFNLHEKSAEVEIESTDIVFDVGLLVLGANEGLNQV
nr:phosphoenolpyruvate carboxylase family protein [Tanacetum cinerariifolium]